MNLWSITRKWLVRREDHEEQRIPTVDLAQFLACSMLGSAGLGKSVELATLATFERQSGLHVRFHRLATLATSAEGLASKLATVSNDLPENSAIYIDALDEAMIPVQTTSLIVATWIREQLANSKPRLRITCRSAVWPAEVQRAIGEVYGKTVAVANLQSVSRDDLLQIAAERGVDPHRFMTAVDRAGAGVLAQQPLTLEMLLQIFEGDQKLPRSRRELFRQGTAVLARDREERRDAGTANDVPLEELLDVAERIACFTLFCGREVVDLSDAPSADSLNWIELSSLPRGQSAALDDRLLRALARCGLCEGIGPNQFRFAHRQFAEYLAACRLAKLLPHQGISVLASGLGWQSGVAGPLRETAAFAAMESEDIAEWLVERDPEVIGISDVASEALRRQAFLGVLEQFRRHEMTDVQVSRDHVRLAGFRYPGVENDLGPVLSERGECAEDVLECAVEAIDAWELQDMSDALANLMLDSSAPMHARRSAGYALERFGTRQARRRLTQLLHKGGNDPENNLRGLALRCLWPGDLTMSELLSALVPRHAHAHYGAYDSFLHQLDASGFDARENVMMGLRWARQHAPFERDHEPATRIAKRIAHNALRRLPNDEIAVELAQMLIDSGATYADSPLNPIEKTDVFGDVDDENRPVRSPLDGQTAARRALLESLVAKEVNTSSLYWIAHHTQGLVVIEDFPWLLESAIDPTKPMKERQNFAELARTLPWYEHQPSIEAWLRVRDMEPVAALLAFRLFIDLDGQLAKDARKQHAEVKRANKSPRRKRVKPSPEQRVMQVLDLSENKDARFFVNLCNELTLEEYSTQYGFTRYLTETPGWKAADSHTRDRILNAAKRLLTAPTDEPERAHAEGFNQILHGYMPAIFLLSKLDRNWLEVLPDDWWNRWAYYILRELHPYLNGEDAEPKILLLEILHSKAPVAVRQTISEFAVRTDQDSRPVLNAILEMLSSTKDPALNRQLEELVKSGSIGNDRLQTVAEFVLSRDAGPAMPTFSMMLEIPGHATSEENAVQVAIALLSQRTSDSWDVLMPFLERRRDLATKILCIFAHHERRAFRPESLRSWLTSLTLPRASQMLELLIDLFPYESDPKHDTIEMRAVLPEDSARDLRNGLLDWIMKQTNAEAVFALRRLEQKYGQRYKWFRRPRAVAERAYRHSQWGPIPPASLAALLHANADRLVRSESDAVEGILAALSRYATKICHVDSDDLEDFWNIPPKGPITPKTEERISGKLCKVIREYFEKYAVTADREVQVYRRKSSRSAGGAPGSEVDVLVRVPAAGSVAGDAIAVPIEVKLSNNAEGRTALRIQLVDRYMHQLGTDSGVFVVVWMSAPKLSKSYKPIWKDLASAQNELAQQCKDVSLELGVKVRELVFDASLPTGANQPARKTVKVNWVRKRKSASQSANSEGDIAKIKASRKSKSKRKGSHSKRRQRPK